MGNPSFEAKDTVNLFSFPMKPESGDEKWVLNWLVIPGGFSQLGQGTWGGVRAVPERQTSVSLEQRLEKTVCKDVQFLSISLLVVYV